MRLSKWMKELEAAFYGSAASYDRALTPGAAAAALPGALRRNVYMGQEGAGGGDPERLARYVRHQLACLAATDSAALMAGHIRFVDHAAALPAASAAARGQ